MKLILIVALVATISLVAVSPFGTNQAVEDTAVTTTLRFTVQTIVMFVSFGVFFIQWLPPRQLKTAQIIFIASAFLSTGLLTFAHISTCTQLLDFLDIADSRTGSYFHMMSGLTMAVSLLIASYIPQERGIRKKDSYFMLLGFLAYTLVVVIIAAFLGSSFPTLCPHAPSGNPTRLVVEIAMIAALIIATAKFANLGRRTGHIAFSYLACATLLGAFNHAAYSLHESTYDLFSVTSEIFTIASFGLVFMALFISAVIQPYERLNTARSQAERRRKEAEAATVKAQTYLDFLSHDVANMISPIMNRAEMILRSPNVSEKEKEEAVKIVEQTQKVSSLIVNLRRLSSAERIDAKALGPVDLRVFLPEIEKTRRDGRPGKELRMAVRYPDEPEIRVMGGSVAEDIIAEIIDNAIKHSKKDVVEVEIDIYPGKSESLRDIWNIEVRDHGPGIPDHVKKALDVASPDPKRRFTRGIASSLSVIPLIAEQLGGRIRIEDRVQGDHTQGTKVIITLPRAT